MADLFISYCSARRELTRELEDRLAAEGYDDVWWDRELSPHAEFGPQIREALEAAKAVIVIWTPEAVSSAYVRAEARIAADADRLVSVRTTDTLFETIPEPFGEFHIAELDSLDDILRGIANAWSGRPPPRALLAEHYFRSHKRHVLAPKQEPVPTGGRLTPATLLNARHALAPFIDVHGRRAELVEWATTGRPLAGRLVHGPGGLGKTRLMAEVCAQLRAADWAAGFVEAPREADERRHRQALEQLIDTDRHAGALLVLDYAERRDEDAAQFAALMTDAARRRPERPLRLVLLARAAGDWWERTVEESLPLQALFGLPDVMALTAFTETDDRRRLLNEAVAVFRERLSAAGLDASDDPPPAALAAALGDDAFARPLMVQIAALLHLQSAQPDTASVAALLDGVLGVERAYWDRSLAEAATEGRKTAIARGAVQTTLVGGAPLPEAEALLLRDPYFGRAAPADAAEPLSDLERLYGDGAGAVLALEPDLVGEHLVLADGDDRLAGACLDWANDDRRRRRTILTVLNRATRDEHGAKAERAKTVLRAIARAQAKAFAADLVAVAFETPGALLDLLKHTAPQWDLEACEAVTAAIPLQTQRLLDLDFMVCERAAQLAREDMGADPTEQTRSRFARHIGALGTLLSNLGRREEALQASEEAVQIHRDLAAARPDAFLPDLAMSLNNLGAYLSNLGRREEALQASEDAVQIYRDLAAARPDAFPPDLAASLNNLGIRFSNLGRREEALQASEEAVQIHRDLAAARPDAFLPDLAMSLNNLGAYLSNLGRREEALQASEDAVQIYRDLAAARPDAFLPDLAMSLNNLSRDLSNLGRREEALQASEEAVAIRRDLAAARPDAFLPDLASSLNNLGAYLSDLGRREEALQASEEAVQIHRDLAAARPDAVLPDLAASLNNLGIRFSNLGRREEALQASEEAVQIYRDLAAARPDAFLPDLAMSLTNLSAYLSNLGRREEALQASEEAVQIYRDLAAARPDAFLPDLAMSLNNLGGDLSNLGRREEALQASEEAVQIYRDLAAARPDAFLPDLAMSLNNLGAYLTNLGRREEALQASEEAVAIRRDLAAARPDAFPPDLARSLGVHGAALSAAERYEDAVAVHAEAMRLLSPYMAKLPDAFGDLFQALLSGLVQAYAKLGTTKEDVRAALAELGIEISAEAEGAPATPEEGVGDTDTDGPERAELSAAEERQPDWSRAHGRGVGGVVIGAVIAAVMLAAASALIVAFGLDVARPITDLVRELMAG